MQLGKWDIWVTDKEDMKREFKPIFHRYGYLESVAGGKSIGSHFTREVLKDPHHLLFERAKASELSGEDAFLSAKKGDTTAMAVINEAIEHLACGIVNAASLLNPEVIILGGGVLNSSEYILPRIREIVDRYLPSLVEMKTSQLEKLIKVAGLGKQKSMAIKNLLKNLKNKNERLSLNYLKRKNDEEVIGELTSHKGIGVKTASCVLLFAFDRNVCPVDTHVHRILNRIGMVKTSNPEKTFNEIKSHIPEGAAHSFHTNLLRLGREYCTPTNPKCYECPLERVCA